MFVPGFRFIQKAAVVHPDEARVLLLRRADDDSYRPGDWDFPGGNVERGELHGAALTREIREETGLVIEHFSPLKVISHVDSDVYVLHIVYTCRAETPAVILSGEHSGYSWFGRAELEALERSRYVAWALEALGTRTHP